MAEEAKKEELEYESDPEEMKLSLKMRRREASDDEEEEDARRDKPKPPRRIVDSDGESDGEGGAAEYEDEEEYDEEIIEEEEYEEREGEVGGEAKEVVEVKGGKERAAEERVEEVAREGREGMMDDEDDDRNDDMNNNDSEQREEGEEKKENEPYAVPTAGAFYMHDDRFRDNAGGRHRRTFGGRKLWESKDGKKWGHDKFEELTMKERHYEEGRRTSRGRFRGRGRNRGLEHGYGQGNRQMTVGSGNNSNQNNAPKIVRGRGPRRYQPSFKNSNVGPPTQNQRSGRFAEKPSHSSSARTSATSSNVKPEAVKAKKHVFASSLNSASPPFYPSGSSSKEIPLTQKRGVQSGMKNRNVQPSTVNETFPVTQSSAMQRGKNVVDSMGVDKLYIDDTTSAAAEKPSINFPLPPSGSSSMSSNQSVQLRAQGRGMNSFSQMSFQPPGSNNQVNRISPPTQLHAQRAPGQNRGQSSIQQFAQNPGNGSRVSSPPKEALNKNSFEAGEMESPSEASKSKTALVAKPKGSVQGTGRGSFLYGGTQVMGNLGSGPGDQNFPAFLPVMQFGSQHTGGIGVPAVGMAFPGYVGQHQQGGIGNSEMTWLPVLAGAAGALGAAYCPPYIAVDGSYHARPSGQPSSLPPTTKENSANKPSTEGKPSQKPEVTNDDFGQRQKNPRRYTEMKFDQ